jgi:hypothetical protein
MAISNISFISLLSALSFYSLSNIPDSNRATKGLLGVLLFNLKISCKLWWFFWIILNSCGRIEFAVRVLLKKHLNNFPDLIEPG